MKYYILDRSIEVNGKVVPGISGENVKGKELFFKSKDRKPNEFYKENYVFDYLVPISFGDQDESIDNLEIFDFHSWHGESPRRGWFRPVSNKFKKLLEQFNLGEHRFYPAKVVFKEVEYQFFVLQVLNNAYEKYIDFSQSEFNNLNSFRELTQPELIIRKFSSISEMEAYSINNWSSNYNYERLVMKSNFRDVDFITLYGLGIIVSDRLKTAIEKVGISGVEFNSLPFSFKVVSDSD